MTEPLAGTELGKIAVQPPGPNSRRLAAALRLYESRNITYVSEDFPIFVSRAAGANVEDVDGNRYVDLTGFFGVAAAGHSNERVVDAVSAQARMLFHGMGDVHPTENKVALAKTLCELVPGDGPKRVIFASTGSEAVEAALKTAAIATGKPGVLCFTGAYHGLTYGALSVTDRDFFKAPFARQMGNFARRVPYPNCYRCPLSLRYPSCEVACLDYVKQALDQDGGGDIGAVIVEPIQARGGDVPAPKRWLADLRRLCDERGLLLILDEIYSGFGRTGRWFACQHAQVVPDIICVGKGLSSGFPIAACVASASVMDRWPESTGESIHTSTFLGNPTGCAAALASIAELRERKLVERAAALESPLRELLDGVAAHAAGRIGDVRGAGLLWGLECVTKDGAPSPAIATSVMLAALSRGVLLLCSGPDGNVISISPPLVITIEQLRFAADVIDSALASA